MEDGTTASEIIQGLLSKLLPWTQGRTTEAAVRLISDWASSLGVASRPTESNDDSRLATCFSLSCWPQSIGLFLALQPLARRLL